MANGECFSTLALLGYRYLQIDACKVSKRRKISRLYAYSYCAISISETDQDLLGVADPPGQISYVAIGLNDFWCKFNAEPE